MHMYTLWIVGCTIILHKTTVQEQEHRILALWCGAIVDPCWQGTLYSVMEYIIYTHTDIMSHNS